MNKEQIIETLEDLKCYIDEEWDRDDPEILKEINVNCTALQLAIDILCASDNVVGTLNIQGENYLIMKK